MEHIVQFAISIDDQTIQKRLEENGYNDILDKIMEEINHDDKLPGVYYGGTKGKVNWSQMAFMSVDRLVDEHKDEIIEAAAEKLAESYKRTKAYKEKMGDTAEKLKKQQVLADRYKDAKFNGEAY